MKFETAFLRLLLLFFFPPSSSPFSLCRSALSRLPRQGYPRTCKVLWCGKYSFVAQLLFFKNYLTAFAALVCAFSCPFCIPKSIHADWAHFLLCICAMAVLAPPSARHIFSGFFLLFRKFPLALSRFLPSAQNLIPEKFFLCFSQRREGRGEKQAVNDTSFSSFSPLSSFVPALYGMERGRFQIHWTVRIVPTQESKVVFFAR